MTKLVAITGKMGSGKSQVLNIFKNKGYCVLSADKIYHELLEDKNFVVEISKTLCIEPIVVDGKTCLDKKKVASIVFADKQKLLLLNKTTHPKIMQELFDRANKVNGVVLCEIPLLQGSGYEKEFSVVIEVVRDEQESVVSAGLRDNLLQKQVADRQKFQPKYENNCGITHIIINNDGSILDLEQKVSAIENKIL